ncbi:MAG: hypothetical protein R2911_07380 [Caldilineaceae bacterium]
MTAVATVVGVLLMMLSISLPIDRDRASSIAMSFGLVGAVLKTSQKFFRSQQALLGTMNGHVEEMYGGHTIVQAFNQQADSIAHFDEINGASPTAPEVAIFHEHYAADDAVCGQHRLRHRLYPGWLPGGEKDD